MPLPRRFYSRPTLAVAEALLGKVLVHRTPEGLASGMIVEVEAYIGEEDPACHAAPGPTTRNQPLYGPPGFAYVYLNYGVHYLFNVVTEADGHPAAVLVRALEPLEGVELMRERRSGAALRGGQSGAGLRARRRSGAGVGARGSGAGLPVVPDDMRLCRGPGNLTKALGITLADNRTDVCADGRLYLEDRGLKVGPIAWGPRIGISVGTEHHWRCYVRDSHAVSGKGSRRAVRQT